MMAGMQAQPVVQEDAAQVAAREQAEDQEIAAFRGAAFVQADVLRPGASLLQAQAMINRCYARMEVGDDVPDAEKRLIRLCLARAQTIMRNASTQSNFSQEARPLTEVPANNRYGNNNTFDRVRMTLADFRGETDKSECLPWLAKVLSQAHQHELSESATIGLMKARSAGTAFDMIEQLARDQLSLTEIVKRLEAAFAGVCLPGEARIKCARMERSGSEAIGTYAARVRKMARVAVRNIPDDDERVRQETDLTRAAIMRILPPHTKQVYEERELARITQGLPDRNYMDMIVELDAIESRRLERINALRGPKEGAYRPANIRTCQVQDVVPMEDLMADWTLGMEELDEITELGMEIGEQEGVGDDEQVEFVIEAVRQAYARGYKGDQRKQFVGNAMNRYSPKNRVPYNPPPGPPRRLKDVRMDKRNLPILAKCDKDECMHCGLKTNPPHRASTPGCPLRDKDLVDRACGKCGKGLHSSDQCPTFFRNDHAKNWGAARQ